MRPLLFLVASCLAASFVVVAPPVQAQAAQPATSFTLVAHEQGGAYFFTLEGQTARNPTLNVPPDTEITITLKGGGGVHNVQVDGSPPSDYVQAAGDQVTYTFRSPASGTVQYWCQPHKGSGMVGKVTVAAAGGGTGAGAGNGTGGAPAVPAAPTEYVFESTDAGGSFAWIVDGKRNPANLPIPPNAQITIRVRNAGGIHNFQVDGGTASEYVQEAGDEVVYTFTSPASGTLEYWCVPHKGTGMKGSFKVVQPGEAPAGQDGGGSEEISGPTVRLGDVIRIPAIPEAATCGDVQVPAAVGDRQIGGPSPEDYLERCIKANGGGGGDEGPQSHPADYVIPASFVLIGLGVVGVVWAHRFYRP